MFKFLASKVFGTRNARYLKSLRPTINKINALEPEMEALSQEEMAARISQYREQVQNGLNLDDLLPEVFAIVRETSKRVLNMRHYDVQLLGGIVLHQGKISEMKTGEGKTLVATLPVVLNALTGKGVHMITVNDYLARRDALWMGEIYNALGLSIGVIVHGITDVERQVAYAADITYGTNNEFGFDYLRDNMKFYLHELVQRGHAFAIVDEVDSILIDEARTPLIISGAGTESTGLYIKMDELVQKLKLGEHFTVDEKSRTALLTEEGVAQCEKILGIDNLFDPASITYQHHILQALRAHNCYTHDVEYLVSDDGKVVIVDEFTSRAMPGRRFGDGLHQALEAKEKVKIQSENQTLASITFQNYFRFYEKLAGMTGTAQTEAVEFMEIYNLETISVPTNTPMIRIDSPDLIYRTQKEKYEAIVIAIQDLYNKRQPVLVGTISIESSEYLSKMLKRVGVPHSVLNAKHHEKEAEIVAFAGQAGNVTIATNMAGRGTDIVLGEGVKELGGLHILGTERNESRRIDNQLRGRSGRQGDSGSSRFYLSLEDNLMRIFGSERISGIMERVGMEEGEPIENKMVSRAIETSQNRVETRNFEIRKTLLDYDNVMNQQREVIYGLRKDLMQDPDVSPIIEEFTEEILEFLYEGLENKDSNQDEERQEIILKLLEIFNITRALPALKLPEGLTAATKEEAIDVIRQAISPSLCPSVDETREAVINIFAQLKEEAGDMYESILRFFLLETLDRFWKEHLRNMDLLREGIGLRGYAQKDPKLEYKREGFNLFQEMLYAMKEGTLKALTFVRVKKQEENALQHKSSSDTTETTGTTTNTSPQQKVGRNDICPCGSGVKYKKCCGA